MGNMFSKSPNTVSIKYLNKKAQSAPQPQPPLPSPQPPVESPTQPPLAGEAVGTDQSLQNAINELNASEKAIQTVLAQIQKTRTMLQQQYENEKTGKDGITPPTEGPAASITTPSQTPVGTPPPMPGQNVASLL